MNQSWTFLGDYALCLLLRRKGTIRLVILTCHCKCRLPFLGKCYNSSLLLFFDVSTGFVIMLEALQSSQYFSWNWQLFLLRSSWNWSIYAPIPVSEIAWSESQLIKAMEKRVPYSCRLTKCYIKLLNKSATWLIQNCNRLTFVPY